MNEDAQNHSSSSKDFCTESNFWKVPKVSLFTKFSSNLILYIAGTTAGIDSLIDVTERIYNCSVFLTPFQLVDIFLYCSACQYEAFSLLHLLEQLRNIRPQCNIFWQPLCSPHMLSSTHETACYSCEWGKSSRKLHSENKVHHFIYPQKSKIQTEKLKFIAFYTQCLSNCVLLNLFLIL